MVPGHQGLLEVSSYRKGPFTVDEIEFIEAATVRVLVGATQGDVDLNQLARDELAMRGMNKDGVWVGFDAAARIRGEEIK